MNIESYQVVIFKAQLQALAKDFICHTRLPDQSVSVSFLGSFQGQTVVWNMTLATLWFFRSNTARNVSAERLLRRPFIEINDGHDGVFQIQVGIDLSIIDEPAIKKTIIMIRNYRRLATGRIEFGSMHT